MVRLIRVETCEECPFGEKGSNAQGDWYLGCTKKLDGWGWNEPVSDIFIPDWCPLEEDRWIPVGERLPEAGESVLTIVRYGDRARITVNERSAILPGADWLGDGGGWVTTHWQPLPALPEEASDEGGE